MKLRYLLFNFSLLLSAVNLSGQANQAGRLFIPFLDKESQSNIVVTISDVFGDGQPCSMINTNVLSNTNLFALEEQKLIEEVFVKYKNVTTNSGPPGTELAGLYKTNFDVKAIDRTVKVEEWVAHFQYTNFDAHEEIRFGGGMLAEFRNKSNDGYSVSLTQIGDGSLLGFGEVKHDLANGLFARFVDTHKQGTPWDYKLANFRDSQLIEYKQYTNGMVLGKFFMWDLRSGKLIIEAKLKEPYDWNKNRIQIR